MVANHKHINILSPWFLKQYYQNCSLSVSRCQSAVSTHNIRNFWGFLIYGTHILLGICTLHQDVCGIWDFNLLARIKTL